jgi:hypothetical protein
MKVRGEPTINEVPNWVERSESYNRDLINCLNWYNSHVDQNQMRSVCEQRAGRSLKNASNNDVMQLGALIRMSSQGAKFSVAHNERIADLAASLIANESNTELNAEPRERQKSVRVDQSKIAISQIDGAIDDYITNGTPLTIETILSQFKFTRDEKNSVDAYLSRVNHQFQEAITSKESDVKEAWSFLALKKRKELVEATNVRGKKTKTIAKSSPVKDVDQIIAVNAKHGIVQVINGSSLKMVGKSVKGFDQKTSYMVRVKGVSSSVSKTEMKKMISEGKRISQPVTGRLGQLWVMI